MSKNAKRLVNPTSSHYLETGKDSIGPYIRHLNGQKEYWLTTAITSGVTATTAAAGSLGRTSNATGLGEIFRSDGANWVVVS